MIEATIRLNVPEDQLANVQDLVLLTSSLAAGFEQLMTDAGIQGSKVEKVQLHQTNKTPEAEVCV